MSTVSDVFVPNRRKVLSRIKTELKKLAKKQKEDKITLSKPHHTLDYVPMYEVQQRAVRISALLNVYHEFKGNPHRHGVRKELSWIYPRHYEEYKSWTEEE